MSRKKLEDLLSTLKQEYLESLPQRCENLQKCLDEKDRDGLITQFHNLKGTGKTYGCPELSEWGEECENYYRSGGEDWSLAENTIQKIKQYR